MPGKIISNGSLLTSREYCLLSKPSAYDKWPLGSANFAPPSFISRYQVLEQVALTAPVPVRCPVLPFRATPSEMAPDACVPNCTQKGT
jgi:hypothetical protein